MSTITRAAHRAEQWAPRSVTTAAIALLVVVAALPFGGTFVGWVFLISAAVGSTAAAAVSVASARFRLLLGEAIGLLVGVYLVVGTVVVGLLPTPSAFLDLVRGAVFGWADLLSTAPPSDSIGQLRAVPFTAAFLGSAVGCELNRHWSKPAVPMVGPALTLALAVLFSVERRGLAIVAGTLLALGLLLLMRLQDSKVDTHIAVGSGRSGGWVRPALALAVLAGVAVAAPVLGPRLPGAGARDRFDLRQFQDNPWDPLAAPSPLVQFKGELVEGKQEEVLFELAGDPIERVAVATLATYDGVVWAVADGRTGEAADQFVPVGSNMPSPLFPVTGRAVTHQVTIRALGSHWLPSAGWPTRVSPGAAGADIRLNERTGTMAVASGLAPGDVYEVASVVTPRIDDAMSADIGEIDTRFGFVDLGGEPPNIVTIAGDLTEGADAGVDRFFRIQDAFQNQGFYDESDNVPPGHTYSRITEFLGDDAEYIVGYGEQYAAAAAVLGRAAGIPTRVVFGYEIDPSRWNDGVAEVRRKDVTAWVEILVTGQGWVAFDVIPDKNRTPEEREDRTEYESVAIPNPPPPPPVPPTTSTTLPQEVVEDDDQDDEEDEDELLEASAGLPLGVVVAGAVAGVPVLGGSIFVLVVVAWKARRRSKRRSGPAPKRISGAWVELSDRFTELGLVAARADTPNEAVSEFVRGAGDLDIDERRLRALADAVDRAAFHPQPPGDDLADASWEVCIATVDHLRGQRTGFQRLKMSADPRPLLRRH